MQEDPNLYSRVSYVLRTEVWVIRIFPLILSVTLPADYRSNTHYHLLVTANLMTFVVLFVCCFTSSQHLKSFQDGCRVVTVCTHGDHSSGAVVTILQAVPMAPLLLTPH